MDKRLFLNVMIIAMLTFYMIFNIVYNRVLDQSDDEPQTNAIVWDQAFLVPNAWHLIRLEISTLVIAQDVQGNWSSNIDNQEQSKLSNIANSWKNLQANSVSAYDQLPLSGQTVLAFVKEDSQPLVFRVVEEGNDIQFFRMIDQKKFSFPLSSKAQFFPGTK
ncbi:MAG: hypothetical protein ACI9N9_000668 [Enterobacterales bacterium]|jgi:hypothetical protein